MYTAITLISATVLSAIILLSLMKCADKTFYRLLKAVTVIFCAIGFFRFMLCDGFIYVINGGLMDGVYYESTDLVSSIIRWGYFANYSVLPMAVFTKSRLFRNIACCYCLPFSILSAIHFDRFMPYFMRDTGSIYVDSYDLRCVIFAVEITLAILIAITVCVRAKHFLRVTDLREVAGLILALPFVALTTMPVYVPQSIVGYSDLRLESYSPMHLLWIALLIVATLILYLIFRFKSYEDRYNLCLFLVLVLFFHYNSLYLMGFNLPRLPIQLCNLAAFFYIVAIPFKLNKFFQFCFIVNVTGALIAIFSPDFATTGIGFWNLHYIFEHSFVFMVPLLAMGLRIFPRANRRSIKYSAIGFSCYFVFCVIGGGLLNIFSNYTGQEVNYFFMFDLEKAESFVSIINLADAFPVTIGAFTFYPILMLTVFIAFSLLCLLFYRFTLYLYAVEDDHLNLRNAGLDILEKRLGRPTKLPRGFQD